MKNMILAVMFAARSTHPWLKESIMKHTLIAAAVMSLIGGNAYAVTDYVDTAQVISSRPVLEKVADSRQECDPAPVVKKDNSLLAPIVGGVLGGLLGHQVGGGRGKTAATIAGAAGGAIAGSAIGNRAEAQPAQQCRTVQSMREVVKGYDVVYRYHGRDVNILMPYDPGRTIKVGIAAIVDERVAESGRDDYGRDGYGNARPVRADDGYDTRDGDNRSYSRRGGSQY